jgi:HSP20 family protein
MERLFDEMLGHGLWRASEERRIRGTWVPAIDVLDRENEVVITVDLPGLNPEDVEVTVEKEMLSIRGERKLDEIEEGESFHRVERLYGEFERSFKLTNSIDSSKIEARFKNGEMVLTLPKREEAKPRSLKIEVTS